MNFARQEIKICAILRNTNKTFGAKFSRFRETRIQNLEAILRNMNQLLIDFYERKDSSFIIPYAPVLVVISVIVRIARYIRVKNSTLL